MKRPVFFTVLALLLSFSIGAADFGLLLAPSVTYGSGPEGKGLGLTGTFTPWLSLAMGENVNFYLSGKITLTGYEYGKAAWTELPVAELDRTELNFRFSRAINITLGRHWFQDQAGMIASGLFDGLTGNFGWGRLRLSGGVYYTGLLYRGTAGILMTDKDIRDQAVPLDYGDFLNTYPASRRVLASIAGDFPNASSRAVLGFNALGQYDFNDYGNSGDEPLHSQYLELRYGLEPLDSLRFTLTGLGAAREMGTELDFSLAAALGAEWEIPGRLRDMLSAELRWGSGEINSFLVPFRPLNNIAQGSIFTPALSGIMNARASYVFRPHDTLSFNAAGAAFWRSDRNTFQDAELDPASNNLFLGAEAYGQITWAPQSALRLDLRGGVFFPLGAFRAGTPLRWNAGAALVVSL
ncbi:MAG: hypothetical protein LBH26_02365 [Treponema sp.]|jgi:hypothetical protein|nr:hypothetical protein [Treponema sp.]